MESDIITMNLERRDHISTKELFSDIQVIPLETTPESLIRSITQIKFFEDRYYILDYRRSQIFVFDREGRFQFALNEKGDGPGQYLNLSDFTIDTARRNLVVLCAVSNALFFYDLGGKFIEKLEFPSGRNQQEKIQYVKDAYASKSVNYVIESHGQNSRYRYAMVVRKNKHIQLFYDRKKQGLLQFERTKEGLQLYPIYFGEDFILCTPEGGLPLDDIFPKKLRNEEQRRIIQSHSDEENPVLIKYAFKNED